MLNCNADVDSCFVLLSLKCVGVLVFVCVKECVCVYYGMGVNM